MDTINFSHNLTAEAARLRRRRLVVAMLCLSSMALMAYGMSRVLGLYGWTAPSILFMAIYLVGLPWTLLGFWNSIIGFVILRTVKDPTGYTNPTTLNMERRIAGESRAAICLAVRNEDADAVFARLRVMIASLRKAGGEGRFEFHVLSDSSRTEVLAAEEDGIAAVRRDLPEENISYRRRAQNSGYKAGNLEEFATRCQSQYDFMIVLDADSVMSGRAMLRLVQIMEARPSLGIVQTLAVGRPSTSAFARIFQFGMRHGMLTHTVGGAWWQGSAGPYWGHNAIIRIKPFVDHCRLPIIPGRGPFSGSVLSHDQVEAALMRSAGWEVRVIPEECDSWEENPTNLPDFIKRDLRWCQGNLQYLRLLKLPGLSAMAYFQLINAIMMYAGAPMNILMIATGLTMLLLRDAPPATGLAFALYAISLGLGFIPRLLGVVDTLLGGHARRYGGVTRLIGGNILDFFFSLFVGPVMLVAQVIFIGGLCFGRKIMWEAPLRVGRALPVREAIRGLWPQTLFGIVLLGLLLAFAPYALIWAALTIVPSLLAIPFACLTASPSVGKFLACYRICAIPEEFTPVPELTVSSVMELPNGLALKT